MLKWLSYLNAGSLVLGWLIKAVSDGKITPAEIAELLLQLSKAFDMDVRFEAGEAAANSTATLLTVRHGGTVGGEPFA